MERTPYKVNCPSCGSSYLTREQYVEQMRRPNQPWRCPTCHGAAIWDDANYESWFDINDAGREAKCP